VTPAFAGAVLCGGRSRRMGRDKALVEVGGVPMARRVASALADAGAADVVMVGGDAAALARLGLRAVADRWPGYGPLGGIVTALSALGAAELLLVAACDLVDPSPATLAATVGALAGADHAAVAAPVLDGRPRWDQAAWRATALGPLTRQFESGERAIHRAVAAAQLTVVDVPGVPRSSLLDADTPADLPPA
jgi:molybdenum cofactor guanylyltransferase